MWCSQARRPRAPRRAITNVLLTYEMYSLRLNSTVKRVGGRYPAQEGADAGSSDDVLFEGDLGGMDPSAFNAGCSGGTSLASFLKVFPTYPAQAEGLHAIPKAYAAVGLPVDDYKVGMNDERHYIIRAKLETPHKALSETDEVDTLFTSEDGTEIDCDDDAHYFCVGN